MKTRFPAPARPARPDDRPLPFALTCLRAGASLAKQAGLLFGLCAGLLAAGALPAQAQSPVSTVKDDQGNDLMQIFDNGDLKTQGTVESASGGFVLPDGAVLDEISDLGRISLPFFEVESSSDTLLDLVQSGSGQAASFEINNENSSASALEANTNGSGNALRAIASGSGSALTAFASGNTTVNAFNTKDGSGLAARFRASNSGGAGDPDNHVVFIDNNGKLNSDGLAIEAGPDDNPGGAVNFLTFYDGDGDIVGQIEGDGNGGIDIQGLNTGDPSDRRLKTGIEPLGEEALRKLAELRPVRYEFNDQETYPSGEQIGLIAQDVQKEFPSLVSKRSNGMLALAYPKLTAVLLKGLQKQQAQIDSLKAENKELKRWKKTVEKRLTRLETQSLEAQSSGGSALAGWPGMGFLLALLAGGLLGAGLARRRS